MFGFHTLPYEDYKLLLQLIIIPIIIIATNTRSSYDSHPTSVGGCIVTSSGFHTGFFYLGGGRKYTHRPKVLGSLAHLQALC